MLASNNATSTPPQDIANRLAELNRWQEEQKRLLEERQTKQRQMLGLEQRNMYQMLGLFHDDIDVDTDVTATQLTMDENLLGQTAETSTTAATHEYSGDEIDKADDVDNDVPLVEQHSSEVINDGEESHTEPTANTQQTSGYGSEEAPAVTANTKPKRAFLRRGEGLKQRFKIDPDQLRIENLPRYKFANAHPQFKQPKSIKRGILKTKKAIKPTMPQQNDKIELSSLDINEKRFQHPLITSHYAFNSTPDLKFINVATNSNLAAKVRFANVHTAPAKEVSRLTDSIDSITTPSPIQGLTWAKVLDPQQVKPIQVLQQRAMSARIDDDQNISIFELMEEKARAGSIDMNSSCVRAFMAKKEAVVENDADIIPVSTQMHQLRIQPSVHDALKTAGNEEAEQMQSSEGTLINTETILSTFSTPSEGGQAFTKLRVRFSDSPDKREFDDDTYADDIDESTSNAELMNQFKAALFKALEKRQSGLTDVSGDAKTGSASNELSNMLQEKAILVKERLAELEQEITRFKENNTQLLHMKQEHELEKATLAQEHTDAMDRLHDEKIQFEIYLHDERMKLDEERRKFEQQMRMQKSNANTKEKKEIATLKQEVESLQQQLKQKEQTHVAAQARLRAQLRTYEKDQKHFYEEIERLTKENKRLEQEALRVGREQNNKMLQEINRNLARLAPKFTVAPPATQVHDETNAAKMRRTKSLGGREVAPIKRANIERQSIYGIVNSGRRRTQSHKENKANDSTTSISDSEVEEHDNVEETREKSQCMRTTKSIPVEDSMLPEEEMRALSNDKSRSNNNKTNKTLIKDHRDVASPIRPTTPQKVLDNANDKQEFKREIINADGSKDVWYPNGNLKKISADGMIVRMLYFNKDIKETDIRAGTVKYYYAETNTWHTTYLDGLEILEFPNGQTEHRHKSGIVEIHFPNNTIKIVDPTDKHKLEEWRYADGTHLVQLRNGDKILNLPNGQKEIHTKLNKRREYPDGTVKIVYPDGSQETRYSNGRVRLKDKDGKLVMDTEMAQY